MKSTTIKFGIVLSSIFVLGALGCSGGDPAPVPRGEPQESVAAGELEDVSANGKSFTLVASESSQRDAGIERWRMHMDETNIIVEGLDAKGAINGRYELPRTQAEGTFSISFSDETGSGRLVVSQADGVVENTTPKSLGAWAGALKKDLETYQAAHPRPYSLFSCIFYVGSSVLGAVGTTVCIAADAPLVGLATALCVGSGAGTIDAIISAEEDC
jgi:hypothetical protein